MRLVELNLEAYGPFTGQKLNFDPAARLHIVHGANEAGKTSALAAIGDLLYGVPPRAEKNFLRPAEMRLGATVEARNGQVLQFFRRRGIKATLLDAGGAVLPEDCLSPFLGAASREIFERAFGLDAKKLRQGGEDMLEAEGELGASLFAAASGLRGLLDLRRGLDDEAEKIFDERKAAHRSFYQALGRFDEARKAEREATLSEGALKTLRREIDEAGERLAALEAEERAADAEQLHLQRLLKAAPILKNLARLREDFRGFDDLAGFSPDWALKLENLLAARDAAREAAARAAQSRDEAREEVEKAGFDAALLARGEDIEALNRAAGAMEKTLDDLPRREKALNEAREKLRLRALTCGLADAEALRAASPDPAILPRAERLIARGRELLAQKIEPLAALEREEKNLDALRAKMGGDVPDSKNLAEKLAAFGPVEKLEDSRAELALDCAEETRRIDERRARLTPALADLDALARAPMPDAGVIEQAARIFDGFAARDKDLQRAQAEALSRKSEAETRLRALESRGAVPSREDLRAAREKRDAAWSGLAFARENTDQWGEAGARFLSAQQQADGLADLLLADAQRVIEAEGERENLRAAEQRIAQAARQARALAEDRETAQKAWIESWRACGVTPAAPAAMARWREAAEGLLAAREALKPKQARLAALEEQARQVLPGLERLAAEAGLPPLPLDAAKLARRIATGIAELARAENESREISAQIAAAPARIEEARRRLAELNGKEMAWRADYLAAVGALGLDADASFDEAQARTNLWRDLPAEWEREKGEAHRVAAMRDDLAGFEQRLDALLAAVARDLPARPALDATKALQKRLAAERGKATTRANAEKFLEKAEGAAALGARKATEAEADLTVFCAAAGFSGEAEALAERLRQRRAESLAIETETGRLALVAEGMEEAALAEQARNFDAEAARLRLSEISRQAEARRQQGQEVFAARREAERQLARLNEGFGAEQAILARESAKAEISAQARRWAVLKLAALMVGAGLEKHRQTRQDPLLARAGEIYAALTGGRYLALRQDFGEDDKLHLQARRADGAALALDALSEGARDQLYLALRLGFLEDYAKKSEAPPFIGDDLFASFDEARAAAGLETLANLNPLLQPILFTHHEHIVDLARHALGDRAQIVRLAQA